MAGKSTFLRQNALIALMAQIGSFVPAARARIGIVDRLFSRVGAADDLARGRSTFMVEMVETAVILNQASERSLVILDEIGRGTATFDGLSIAWAAIEHLHEANRCRTLFATHYHELTALSAKLPRLFNATVRVKEWQGDVVFLHEVLPGSADRSYGIQVAKLAGLPAPVIARAKSVLAKLEAQDRGQTARALADDLPLFAIPSRASAEPEPPSETQQLIEALGALHPDEMSPRDALEALYALKAKLPKANSERTPANLMANAPELPAPVPPQPEIPDHASCQREAERNRRAETWRRHLQHRDGYTDPDQPPAAIGNHRRGRTSAHSRMQDQHHAGEHHWKQRDRCR